MTAVLRAPEASVLTNGFCSSGPVLEQAAPQHSDTQELRSVPANPLTVHSAFAPAFHPFDLPVHQAELLPSHHSFLNSELNLDIFSPFLASHGRPPIALSF